VQKVRPRPNEEYETAPGYGSARKLIKAMEARGEVVLKEYKHKQHNRERRDRTVPKLIMLPKDSPPAATNWWHEVERGELYVAFHKTEKIGGWWSKWPIREYREYAKNHKLFPDVMFEIVGKQTRYAIELDRGTEDWGDLEDKVDKYAGLQMAMPQNPLCPIFALQPGYTMDLNARGKKMVEVIRRFGRNQSFLVSRYDLVIQNPLGSVYDDCYSADPASPLDMP
jgi:hypothetical protein